MAETQMAICEVCHKEFKAKGMHSHKRMKHGLGQDSNPVVKMKVSDLKHFEGPRNTRDSIGMRMINAVEPRCDICNHNGRGEGGWFRTCPHNPYWSEQEFEEVTDDLGPADAEGKQTVLGQTKRRSKKIVPNSVKLPWGDRFDGTAKQPRMINYGYKTMAEVGVADYCDFYNCWTHEITVRGEWGNYCSENQKNVAKADILGIRLEVFHERKRAKQMAELSSA